MTLAPPPPALADLRAGTQLVAGMGRATILPDIDFETYSEAGYVWDAPAGKWRCLPNAAQGKKGLPIVGAAVYAMHPSTEVLSFAYDLKDGTGSHHWRPGLPNPANLFAWIARGGLLEAHYSGFEHWIWNYVCTRRYGWPWLPQAQLRDSGAKARAHCLPSSLGKLGAVLGIENQKDTDGARLLKKFSMPRDPTKTDPRLRIVPVPDAEKALWETLPAIGVKKIPRVIAAARADAEDTLRLYAYNTRDIVAEGEASALIPDIEGEELDYFLVDQAINYRGVAIDLPGVEACCSIIDQALERYNAELYALTGGQVARASEIARLTGWLGTLGIYLDSLDEDAVDAALKRTDLPAIARRALQIRATVGSASVKKVYSMRNRVSPLGRLHDLYNYHGARTGRATGDGPQPTNLPNSGPDVWACECGAYFGLHRIACPECGESPIGDIPF
jgi:DNA polymerase